MLRNCVLPVLFILGAFMPQIYLGAQRHSSDSPEIDSLRSALQNASSWKERCAVLEAICRVYVVSGKYDSARKYADTLASVAGRSDERTGLAGAYFYYGVISRHLGDYNDALGQLERSIEYYTAAGDSAAVARALFHAGAVRAYMGRYDQSLAIFYRILAIHEGLRNYQGVGYTLNGIGIIYRNTGKFDDAVEVFQRAIALYDSVAAPADEAAAIGNLANVYASKQLPAEALSLYHRVLAIDMTLGNEQTIAFDLGNIGTLHNDMGRHDSALVYHLRALNIRERSSQKYDIAMLLKQVGHTYFYLKQFSAAEDYLLKALNLARSIEAKALQRDICEYLAELYAANNQFSKAYDFQKQHAVLKDSVLNTETTRQLNELQTRYETEKKDQQIMLLGQEKKLQETEARRQAALKEASAWGALLVTVLAGLVIYIFRQRIRNQRTLALKNQELRDANFRQQLSELEMKALQAQINPHFLFNCMNSINRMILEGDNKNASRYLAKFSKLVRLILENARTSTVSLENEIALLESYINLEQLRFKGRMQYTISVDQAIDRGSTYLPSMLLQPFVENAIWHGLLNKPNGYNGLLVISIEERNGRLFCAIEDNGIGREKAQELKDVSMAKMNSMGIKITEERLRLLGEERLINIVDLKDPADRALGTRVEINIPIRA